MLAGKSAPMEKFPQGTARDELGAMAGVSGKTYEHAGKVLDNAPAPVIQATRNAELSIGLSQQVLGVTTGGGASAFIQETLSLRVLSPNLRLHG